MNKKLILFICIFLFPSLADAATYSICASGCDHTTIAACFSGHDLAGDDICEIQDSRTYTENVTWGSNDGGSAGHLVTLRAATGQTPTIAGTVYAPNLSYIRIGQIGYGIITFDPTTTGWIDGVIHFYNTDYSYIENIHIHDVYDGNGIILQFGSDHNIIQYNTIHDIGTSYAATGSQGEGINLWEGTGGGADGGASYNTIQYNTITDSAHSQITLHGGLDGTVRYNQVIGNYLNSGRGELISFLGCEYNLADGNRLYNCATVHTGLAKPAVQMSGSSNCSIRRNVIYNGNHYYAFEMYSYNNNYTQDDNYIYNNTIHTWGTDLTPYDGSSAVILGDAPGLSGTSSTGNKFYNNIFWDINYPGQNGWYDGTRQIVIWCKLRSNDWGSSLAELRASSLGGNEFKNNILRSHGGVGYSYVWSYSDIGAAYILDITTADLNSNFTGYGASGNIESDPLFSTSPVGNLGASDTWWNLQAGSPAINAGIVVTDANASTGGWAQLTYNGAAPDIGAYESGDASTSMSLTGVTISGGKLQ